MDPITIIGCEGKGGVYLLRLRIAEPLAVAFGRFRQGQPQPLPAGEMVYVGSALGGLAARLLHHATRTHGRPPQPIRTTMLAEFPALGLAGANLRPPTGKKLHWHVDYLLDETAVTLTHVILLRTPARLEVPLGRWLGAQPETAVIAPGLGARDVRGSTHLLRIAAPESWWQALPARFQAGLDTGDF
ncbi:MAG: DUF123 domain-containing protein [Ardenticatenaceae bacterium]|nr:DUF123 domain-containing protein [Ardenticatenaceae bacterium]